LAPSFLLGKRAKTAKRGAKIEEAHKDEGFAKEIAGRADDPY
jgi:hypothetical protein